MTTATLTHPLYGAPLSDPAPREVDGVTFRLYARGGGLGPVWLTDDHHIELIRAYRGTTYMVRVDGKHIGSGYRDFESAARAGIKEIAA